MELVLTDLEKYFDIRKEETALFFIFLTLLAPGTSVDVLNGNIHKITEDTFKLSVDKDVFHRITDDFITEEGWSKEEKAENDYNTIFSQGVL